MAWLQLTLDTTEDKAEQFSECLINAGAVSVTLEDAKDQPLFEPLPNTTPLWNSTRVVGLFEDSVDIILIKKKIAHELKLDPDRSLNIEPLAEQNWTLAWMDQFQPMRFGDNLWICPTFRDIPDPTAFNILLDPGMAFGTGTHPTTRLCLEWLDKNPPLHNSVLDYGCGSGVLAIAALKLGAKFVSAVDHDPLALQGTKTNAELNHIPSETIALLLPSDVPIKEPVDLILANILANPLITLAPLFAQLVKSKGLVVLSGILKEQLEIIEIGYAHWFKIREVASNEDWIRVTLIRL